jgi:hypothetical protein
MLMTLAIVSPVFIGVYLSFLLKKTLCPQLGFWGAKTDDSGRYLFMNSG